MFRATLISLRKEFLLFWRDRVGLFMLIIAPIAVISVAGFSLANLYGADLTGATLTATTTLYGADLRCAAVTADQLTEARKDQETKLPDPKMKCPRT